jgi:hypothetical protein
MEIRRPDRAVVEAGIVSVLSGVSEAPNGHGGWTSAAVIGKVGDFTGVRLNGVPAGEDVRNSSSLRRELWEMVGDGLAE